ncbi:cytochrome b/b6 domain-containing protein [Aeromonas veronii]
MEKMMPNNNEIKVWDLVVRFFHWATVALCVLNLFILEEGYRNHRYVGYTLSGLLVIRIVWGFWGSHYAKFTQWFPTPTRVTGYVQASMKGEHPYHAGHNPMGSLMIILLLTCLVGTAVTGILTNYEDLFGDEVMEGIHEFFAKTLQIAIFVHVLAVIAIDRLTHGDLIRAMITGKKRVPSGVDVVDKC